MSLASHLLFHVFTALIAGYIVWRFWRHPLLSFGIAFVGAVLIDLDHLIDYYIAFGSHFDMLSFIHGEQFAKNDKIYVLFHGWEYVILLIAVSWLIKSNIKLKVAVLALALGAFFHLLIDVNVNHGMTVQGYSVVYRAIHYYMKRLLRRSSIKNIS
jgi:hypothetical protein